MIERKVRYCKLILQKSIDKYGIMCYICLKYGISYYFEVHMKFEELIKKQGFEPASVHIVIGLDRQVIFNYRKGKAKPSIDSILRIANALNTSTDEVINCFYAI